MNKLFAVFMIAGILITGCAQRKVVTSEEMQPSAAQQPQAKEPQGGPEKITEQQVEKVESRDVPSRTEEVSGLFADIYFDYDDYDIREDAKPTLRAVADHLIKDPSRKALIEGHCDERGTNEYNLALGDRRAKTAKDYLVSLGVPSARIDAVSYGEEKPACREQTEVCWTKNRRGHFIFLSGRQ